MRVLVMMHLFLPDRHGSAAAHSDLWISMAKKGVDVTVRCPHPFDPEVRAEWKTKGGQILRYEHDGVKIERYGVIFPRTSRSLLGRLIFEVSYFFSFLRSLLRGRQFDLFVVYSPYASAVAFAGLMKLLYRKPLWMHVLDVTVDAAKAAQIVRAPFLVRLLADIERQLFNIADVWSTISPNMVRFLSELQTRGQRILLLPNWVEPSLLRAIQSLPERPVRTAGESVKLLYVGSLGEKQNLLGFCQTLHASDAAFTFRIFCHGSNAAPLKQWVHASGDPRFACGYFLEDEDYARELNATDFYVITERRGSGAAYFPGKIIVALAVGVPVLAVCDAESSLGLEMEQYGLGPRFDWSDLGSVVLFLKDMAAGSIEESAWRENSLARGKYFDRQTTVDRFHKSLVALAAGGDPDVDPERGDA